MFKRSCLRKTTRRLRVAIRAGTQHRANQLAAVGIGTAPMNKILSSSLAPTELL